MKRLKVKSLLALTMAGVLAACMAGCSESRKSGETSEASAAGEKSTVTIWATGSDNVRQVYEALIEDFNNNSDYADQDVYKRQKPDTAEDGGASFEELRAVNPDVCAWLTLDHTNIDQPILQGKDNLSYINTDVYGNFAMAGSCLLYTSRFHIPTAW